MFKAPPRRSGDKPIDVSLLKSGRTLRVEPGTSILDAALAVGIPVPHSCKRGECGLCAARVVSGAVSHRDRLLSDVQRQEDTPACVCVGWAQGDAMTLDL